MHDLQGMVGLVQESTVTMVNSWKSIIEAGGGIADIKIDQHMRSFSGDVISRACFGSNYSQGEEIFKRLRALQEAASKRVLATGIPGARYVAKFLRNVPKTTSEIEQIIFIFSQKIVAGIFLLRAIGKRGR